MQTADLLGLPAFSCTCEPMKFHPLSFVMLSIGPPSKLSSTSAANERKTPFCPLIELHFLVLRASKGQHTCFEQSRTDARQFHCCVLIHGPWLSLTPESLACSNHHVLTADPSYSTMLWLCQMTRYVWHPVDPSYALLDLLRNVVLH